MKRTLLFAVILLMTLSCNKSTSEPTEIPFSALGEIVSFNTSQMIMKTDQDLTITFNGVNSSSIMLETGRRIYAVGSLTEAPIDNSYQATFYGLSFVSINKTYLYEDIKDQENWRENLGNNPVNLFQAAVSGDYLTIFTESKSDYLSLVITNSNISDGAISIDADLCNNTSIAGGGVITSFDISEYIENTSGTINIKYKSGNSASTEYSVTWDKK